VSAPTVIVEPEVEEEELEEGELPEGEVPEGEEAPEGAAEAPAEPDADASGGRGRAPSRLGRPTRVLRRCG